ncbi:MAG: DUF4214 domain-containing protein [Acidimicrobiales bacterium]
MALLSSALLTMVATSGLVVPWPAAPAAAQPTAWRVVKSYPPVPSNLNGVSCASTSDCVAVGQVGSGAVALYSTDGGSTWSTGTVPSEVGESSLSSVSCASTSDCVAVGYYLNGSSYVGTALYSTDGGSTWSTGTLPGGVSDLSSVSCASTSDCVAVGQVGSGSSEIGATLYSTDGGSTWSTGTLPGGVSYISSILLHSVSCASTSDCVAVGEVGNGTVALYSTDGGSTWSTGTVPSEVGESSLSSVSCASTSDCVAVGGYYGGLTLYSTDGGATWGIGSLPSEVKLLRSVSCASTSDCVAVGFYSLSAGAALYSTDGGVTWSAGTLASEVGILVSVSCASTSDCFATGEGGNATSVGALVLSFAPVPPAPPIIGTATAGNAKATVRFTPPADIGGSAITGYTVTATDSTTPANGGETASGTSSPITVTGLTNGDSYTFNVVATNAVGSSESSATSNAATPTNSPCLAYTGNAAFVCWVYEDLLGRAPDSGGLTYWVGLAGVSRTAVAAAILASSECQSDLVTTYYDDFLSRGPDSSGLTYWVDQLNGGAKDESVLASILGSDEVYTDSGAGYDGNFVAALYNDLLDRTPDSTGLTYWENQLSSGANRSAVAAAILASNEYRNDFVKAQYTQLLGRAADSGGLTYWVAQLAAGASDESVIASIVGSSEFYSDATS